MGSISIEARTGVRTKAFPCVRTDWAFPHTFPITAIIGSSHPIIGMCMPSSTLDTCTMTLMPQSVSFMCVVPHLQKVLLVSVVVGIVMQLRHLW